MNQDGVVRIGIVQLDRSLKRRYMFGQYLSALKAVGAQPVVLQQTDDPGKITGYLGKIDGLLLPGGPDIDPSLYGEDKTISCGKQSPLRDRMEPVLLSAALDAGKPVLGVCRGLQLANVALGGTLWQDIDSQRSGSFKGHTDFIGRRRDVHSVTVLPDTKLAAITGATRLGVNSIHHQAARDLAPGLIAAAVADDGIIEALEKPGYPFLLAVQWHPEFLFRNSPAQHQIFQAFADACKKETPST